MREIVNKLHENRRTEVAESVLEADKTANSNHFQVGDEMEYTGVMSGLHVSQEVIRVNSDTIVVEESWISEDTGETVKSRETYEIEQDERGNDCIVVWEYSGHLGRVYPPKRDIKESLQKGDPITLWWTEPNFPMAYASCEYVGKTRDGKYRFRSDTYGWYFIVDPTEETITKEETGKSYPLNNATGWMTRVFNDTNSLVTAKLAFTPTNDTQGVDLSSRLADCINRIPGVTNKGVRKIAGAYHVSIECAPESLEPAKIAIENCGFFKEWKVDKK